MVETELNLHVYLEPNWPEGVKRLALKSSIIKLNARFLRYLNSDGVIIHKKYYIPSDWNNNDDDLSFSDDDDTKEKKGPSSNEGSDLDHELDNDPEIEFPEFEPLITEALTKYSGALFLKLNWKAPRVSQNRLIYLKNKILNNYDRNLKVGCRN